MSRYSDLLILLQRILMFDKQVVLDSDEILCKIVDIFNFHQNR